MMRFFDFEFKMDDIKGSSAPDFIRIPDTKKIELLEIPPMNTCYNEVVCHKQEKIAINICNLLFIHSMPAE